MQQQLTVFSKLPARLADGLALGSVGKGHLLRLARLALASPGNEALGQELALAAWEADPLDGELAAQLEPVVSGVDTRTLQCIRDVRINWQRPQRPEYYQRLLQKRDMDRIFTYLYSQHEKEPQNLFWLQQALGMAAYEGAFDWLSSWLGKGNYPQALEKKIQGDLAFFQKSYDAAAAYYLAAWDFGGLHPALVRHAESLFRLGDTDNAIALGREALAVRPWQTNQLLTLHDRLTGLSGERTALPGQVAVLLYSYNKADDLRRTLDTLVPQLPASASVFVLDNGSSDDTAALLAGWEEQFSRTAGEARFQSIRLPVNIGAPAARNWLVAMEAARPYEWLAFLDDDAPAARGLARFAGTGGKRFSAGRSLGLPGRGRAQSASYSERGYAPNGSAATLVGRFAARVPALVRSFQDTQSGFGFRAVRLPAAVRIGDRLLPFVPAFDAGAEQGL